MTTPKIIRLQSYEKIKAFLQANVLFLMLKHIIMSWIILIIAGMFEVGFTTCLKLSNNFSNIKWTIGFVICITLSFFFLNKATQTLPMGTAYAVWTGIGAVGTVLIGIVYFGEPANFWRIFFIATLIGSILGLKFFAGSH